MGHMPTISQCPCNRNTEEGTGDGVLVYRIAPVYFHNNATDSSFKETTAVSRPKQLNYILKIVSGLFTFLGGDETS